ncbi:MAG: SPOR domain-containing protein, partial [Pseudomonadota bacterium]
CTPYFAGHVMGITRIMAWAALGCGVFAGAVGAQTGQVPAEFPPASYTAAQYVDSTGCVFIRAGIDGNVTWVPRVNRQRRQICGQTPSLTATAQAQPAPATAAPQVEQITVAPPEPTPAPAPRPARTQPTVVATPAPAPAPTARTAPRPAQQTQAARPAPARVAPAPAPAPQTTARAEPACPGIAPVSGRYINPVTRRPVRCGPQPMAGHGGIADGVEISQNTRVLPRHVYEKRLQEQGAAQIPPGYRAVWNDDRLNPRRAEQSLGGIAQSRLFWTNTVPRRLIDHSSGRDVTSEIALVYPYTDAETQQRELGTVTLMVRDGQLIKRIKRNRARSRAADAPDTTKVTRAAPKPKAAKGRYVQVGTFGVDANARSTAQRLARAGLPARIGTLKRGSKSYRVVLAGPFASSGDLSTGLRKARSLGFADAFVR